MLLFIQLNFPGKLQPGEKMYPSWCIFYMDWVNIKFLEAEVRAYWFLNCPLLPMSLSTNSEKYQVFSKYVYLVEKERLVTALHGGKYVGIKMLDFLFQFHSGNWKIQFILLSPVILTLTTSEWSSKKEVK